MSGAKVAMKRKLVHWLLALKEKIEKRVVCVCWGAELAISAAVPGRPPWEQSTCGFESGKWRSGLWSGWVKAPQAAAGAASSAAWPTPARGEAEQVGTSQVRGRGLWGRAAALAMREGVWAPWRVVSASHFHSVGLLPCRHEHEGRQGPRQGGHPWTVRCEARCLGPCLEPGRREGAGRAGGSRLRPTALSGRGQLGLASGVLAWRGREWRFTYRGDGNP